nr:hypothetical protein CFP56_63503 [Quercus suber]
MLGWQWLRPSGVVRQGGRFMLPDTQRIRCTIHTPAMGSGGMICQQYDMGSSDDRAVLTRAGQIVPCLCNPGTGDWISLRNGVHVEHGSIREFDRSHRHVAMAWQAR